MRQERCRLQFKLQQIVNAIAARGTSVSEYFAEMNDWQRQLEESLRARWCNEKKWFLGMNRVKNGWQVARPWAVDGDTTGKLVHFEPKATREWMTQSNRLQDLYKEINLFRGIVSAIFDNSAKHDTRTSNGLIARALRMLPEDVLNARDKKLTLDVLLLDELRDRGVKNLVPLNPESDRKVCNECLREAKNSTLTPSHVLGQGLAGKN